ncbi:hypothetical protein KM22_04652 [Bordetella bronchiseptica KM22]|nr:hypothetical protein KM22_04652 [Bordetella bronchiseptica KM22]
MYSKKSQISRSHWLPSDTQALKRICSRHARSYIDTMSAPLWLIRPMLPGSSSPCSTTSEDVNAMRWWGLMMPMQFGPTSRMPASRAMRTIRPCRATPSSPSSANPADTITQAPTPAAAHSPMACSIMSTGSARMATSTGPRWAMLGTAGSPATSALRGLTGITVPR